MWLIKLDYFVKQKYNDSKRRPICILFDIPVAYCTFATLRTISRPVNIVLYNEPDLSPPIPAYNTSSIVRLDLNICRYLPLLFTTRGRSILILVNIIPFYL